MIQTIISIIVIAIALIYFGYIEFRNKNAHKGEERIKAKIIGDYENACRYYDFNGTTIIDPISVQKCVIDKTFALKVTSYCDGTFIDTYIKYNSKAFIDKDYLGFCAIFGKDIFGFNDENITLIILDKKYFKNFIIELRENKLYLTIYNNYNCYKYHLNYGYEYINIADRDNFKLRIKYKFKIEEEQKMRNFKVGDKVRIKSVDEIRRIDKDLYGIHQEDLNKMQGKVYTIESIECNENTCKLLEDIISYIFKCDYLEKVDTFYKTLPNDYSGKLVIEKGQVIEKEDKKEILDEVEKEYLRAVIKPFRKRMTCIKKSRYFNYEFIILNLDNDGIFLPSFKKGKMYKGMKEDKEYTLEELGL